MNKTEFMQQTADSMTVAELAKAIQIKQKQNSVPAREPDREMTFAEEIKQMPERFEMLNSEFEWDQVFSIDGVADGTAKILNDRWNNMKFDGVVYFTQHKGQYNELIRRKE